MTDDDAMPDSADVPAPTPASRLLALQDIDSRADLLRGRRDRLAERAELATVTDLMTAWEQRRRSLVARLDELAAVIDAAEAAGAVLTADRDRLQAQLKTVIAPREAEALMHEIDNVDQQRSELDDRELAALEEQAEVDDELSAHLTEEGDRRAALEGADTALAAACADIDVELAELEGRRVEARNALDAALVARYDKVRGNLGVAVARLRGHRCEGCHLDLSAAEIDTAKGEAGEAGFTDCPQCGRMLVV